MYQGNITVYRESLQTDLLRHSNNTVLFIGACVIDIPAVTTEEILVLWGLQCRWLLWFQNVGFFASWWCMSYNRIYIVKLKMIMNVTTK